MQSYSHDVTSDSSSVVFVSCSRRLGTHSSCWVNHALLSMHLKFKHKRMTSEHFLDQLDLKYEVVNDENHSVISRS